MAAIRNIWTKKPPKKKLAPIHKRLFLPISSLCSKFYHQNINYMPVVKFSHALISTKIPRFWMGTS